MAAAIWSMVIVAGAIVAQPGSTPPSTKSGNTPAPVLQPNPAPPATPQGVGEFAGADHLLTALESADRDLKTLSCELLWIKEFDLGGDTHTKKGKLFFVDERTPAEPKPPGQPTIAPRAIEGKRKFAVSIEGVAMQGKDAPEQRVDRKVEEFVFDGVNLIERRPAEKVIVHHRLPQKPGADPLKIGEGPIPLPIGQKREDILSRFVVELLPAEKDLLAQGVDKEDPQAKLLLSRVAGCVQLRLIPKPEHERECSFKEARLWFRRSVVAGEGGRLLPRMARATNKQHDIETVILINIKVNGPIDAVFDTKTPTGWEKQEL
jgi:hypothetical protein